MVQVLPYVPGFGEKLGQAFGQAATNAVQGYKQHRINEQDQKILNSFDPNAPAMEQIKQFGKLSAERQKHLTPLFTQYIKSSQGNQKAAEINEEQEVAQNMIQSIRDNLKYSGKTFGHVTHLNSVFKREAIQAREDIDTTGVLLADKVFTKFNKGTISKDKLKLITEKLAPNSSLSDRENEARLESIERVLGLPVNASEKALEKAAGLKEGKTKKEAPSLEDIFK